MWTAPWQALFCAERFGRLRSYVRPGGAAHMSAGPDEVRRPGIPIRFASSSSCLTTGCFWSSVATVSFIAFQCACQTSNCDLCNCSVDRQTLGGGGRTRTYEGLASGFTVRPLCRSGHSPKCLQAWAQALMRTGLAAVNSKRPPEIAPHRCFALRTESCRDRN